MHKVLKKLINPKNRLVFITIIFFFLLILSSLIFPYYEKYVSNNWNEYINQKLIDQAQEIQSYFNLQQEKLISESKNFLKDLKEYINKSSPRIDINEKLFEFLSIYPKDDVYFQVFDEKFNLKAWINSTSAKTNVFSPDEFFKVYQNNFKAFLIYTTPIEIHGQDLFLTSTLELESNYQIQNEFIKNFSLSNYFSTKFGNEVQILWDTVYFSLKPAIMKTEQGIIKPINFQNGKPAFYVIIKIPDKEIYLEILNYNFGNFQRVIFFVVLVILIFSIFKDLVTVESRFIQALSFTFLIWLLRFVLLYLNLPAIFLSGDIVNPSVYASRFLFGLAKSPIELFLTASTLAINVFLIYILTRTHFVELNQIPGITDKKRKIFTFSFSFILIVLTPFVLRGFGSTFRSFVFDSTIKFFEQPSLISNITILIIYYSIFVVGITLILFLLLTSFQLIKTISEFLTQDKKLNFLIVFLALSFSSIIFYFFDAEPQFSLLTVITLLLFSTLLSLNIFYEKSILTFKSIFLILVLGSLYSSIFIYEKNEIQEKSFQKTISYELLKSNDQFLNLVINQTLSKVESDEDLQKVFFIESQTGYQNIDFNYLAYKYWINSILSDEGLNSQLYFFDKYGKILGNFGFGINVPEGLENFSDFRLVNTQTIFLIKDIAPKKLLGIVPLKYLNSTNGYCGVLIDLESSPLNTGSNNVIFKNIKYEKNPFKLIPDAVVYLSQGDDFSLLKGSELPEIRKIDSDLIDQKLNEREFEFWIKEKIGDQIFNSFYFIYNPSPAPQIISVSVPEKNITLVIFNLFKLMLIHIIISVILILIGTIILLIKGYKFKLRFKTSLFIGLFVITLIPIILLAYFTRESELQRWKENLSNDLKKDLDILSTNFVNKKPDLQEIIKSLEIVSSQLQIELNLYKDNLLTFSTQQKLYDIGFFDKQLSGKIFKALYLDKKNYFYGFEYISNYPYLVGYKRIIFDNFDFVLSIPTIYKHEKIQKELNKIDTFIFGAYTLTLLLIFIFGNLFFEKLTKPISELTEATKKVSQGDLSIKLDQKESGEVGDLIEAFNKMIRDLDESRKNLARIEREQAWKEMAKQVAHEIKNPLTPMKLSLQHLQFLYKENRNEFSRLFGKISATLIEQIETLTKITNEFSHFARMPERKIVKCNLEEILREVISLFSTQLKIEFDFVKNENYFIDADKEELTRVFINLIKNSIQASATSITIKLFRDVNNCFVKIEDNGAGIPQELIDKIFDPNFSTKTEGTGLGLPIVKRILSDIGGTIEIKSEIGNGTIVMISIPVSKEF